ncbi:hypothetical protein RND81_13G113600 [Saponaria officinalis]|uniref:Uncharacterized protein n=1 Tax=Saponaria officinalis TaxID=3572 RepID=A0AAW1H231_SAPOF
MAAIISSSNLVISPLKTPKMKSFTIPNFKSNHQIQTHKFFNGKLLRRRSNSNSNFICNSYSSSSSSSSSSFDVSNKKGKMQVDTCLVVPPPKYRNPRAIIKFLGGAFIGKVSHLTYSYLVEFLAKEGYLVVLVPYNVTFNHEDATKQVYERFNACLDILLTSGLPEAQIQASQLVDLPVFSVGHSNGALLQVLIASYFPDKIPKANAIVSFNNRPATEAVPYFEQLGPLVSQVMPMVETTPVFSMANSLSGDAWKALLDGAGAVMSQNDPELLSSVTQFVDQLSSVLNEVRQGTSEFRPTPSENRECCKRSYNVPHTLLVKFSFDAIDETDVLEETLRPRVQSIGGTLEKIQLSGNHLTPCIQEPKWEVGNMYTPIDAVAQGLKVVSLNDTKVLAQTICSWLRRYEQ